MMTTGHAEAAAQIAGETGYLANQTDAIIVFSDGRTEHVALFTADTKKPVPQDDTEGGK